ncbi:MULTISPECIES: type II toxin-antitoxin system RelE family toxin [Methylomicrobium]|jgi:mRNA interferase RelE/StbE|uniref:Addiction module toxin, RelE/StbE family n=1 Tax=Methylomicrobium album BG8 TaxID=686340 RepID=H8GMM3_METAL|nr:MULTISPECIES: type II toxin-antitoxin system RelE/ParE family toxin [Methylomicrobium]EIC28263.1 addiction module toxin, RelE/StbE family [Methylomicrobium album BG8]
MTYKLRFKEQALEEWNNLDQTIREQFAKKLRGLKENPRIDSARLSSLKNCYKIKLRKAGYRLVYEVREQEVVILIVAIGKRERNQVYKTAAKRL